MSVLCTTRTLSLLRPLHRVRSRHLLLCLILYLLYLTLSRGVLVLRVVYDPSHLFCVAQLKQSPAMVRLSVLLKVLKILIPVVPSIAGCLVTVYHLKVNKNTFNINDVSNQRNRNHVAITTVIILTVIFLSISIPHFLLLFFQVLCEVAPKQYCVEMPHPFFHHLFCFYLPNLNSLFNSLVYLIRVRRLRQYSLKVIGLALPWNWNKGAVARLSIKEVAVIPSEIRGAVTVVKPNNPCVIISPPSQT